MARVRLEVQGREVFRTRLRVRVDDVHYGGHLGNDSVLTLCHEARLFRLPDETGRELPGRIYRDVQESAAITFGLMMFITIPAWIRNVQRG
jgi:hypothetical protein